MLGGVEGVAKTGISVDAGRLLNINTSIWLR
jgi:hypothetical protein